MVGGPNGAGLSRLGFARRSPPCAVPATCSCRRCLLSEGGWLAHFASNGLPHQARANMGGAGSRCGSVCGGCGPGDAVARFDFPGRGLVTVLALPLLLPYVTAGTWTVSSRGPSSRAGMRWPSSSGWLFLVFIVFPWLPRALRSRIAAARVMGPGGDCCVCMRLYTRCRLRPA